MVCCLFFFFKQKTAYEMRMSDWSSDVCSSDLRSMRSLIAVEAAINLASKQTGQLPSKSLLQKAPFCAQSHRKTANFFYPLDVTKLIALWKLSGCESKNKKRPSGKRWV